MAKNKESFDFQKFIGSIFQRTSNVEKETAEKMKDAKEFSKQNRKVIRERQEEFKNKWR